MPFKGRDFLVAAHFLAGERGNEACERSAVSRAYYSSFHQTRDYCVDQGWPLTTGPKVHLEIRNHLRDAASHAPNDPIEKRFKSIEQNLHRLRLWRNDADYNVPLLRSTNLSQQVQLAIDMAENVIKTVDSLPT